MPTAPPPIEALMVVTADLQYCQNLSNDVAFQLDKRIVCFIHNALNNPNKVCRLLLLATLNSISSTFATNYRHLCYKYELVQTDWHSGLAHLLGKVKMKYQNKNAQNCPPMSINRELCDIRNGKHIACDIISKAEVCSLLDIICTDIFSVILIFPI